MRIASQRALERLALLTLGLALGGLLAAHPALASLRQPSTTPIAWMAPPRAWSRYRRAFGDGRALGPPGGHAGGPIYTVYIRGA